MAIRSLAGSAALVLVLSSPALHADVTPEQVWQSWQDAINNSGGKIAASEAARDGDTLVVSGLVIGDASQGMASIDTLSFTDNGDGTVEVTLPDTFPVTFTTPAKDGNNPSVVVFAVNAPGTTLTASGSPEAISYKADAPNLDIVLDKIDAAPASAANAAFEAKLEGLEGTYEMSAGGDIVLSQDMKAKSIAITAKGKSDTDASSGDFQVSLADLASTWKINAPKGFDKVDLTKALDMGFSITGNFGFGATSFDVNALDAGGKATQVVGGLASGSFGLTMDKTKFDYSTDSKGAAFKVTSPDIPVDDASFTFGQAGLHLVMPVAKSDTPADFSFLLNLVDLAPSEAIWAMADPTKGLKHDPATLIIDTKGKATMTSDIFADTKALEGGNSAPPGILNALDLTNINLKALGAEITALGSFTFDNTDMTTFNGVPAPTGKVDIKATGVNAVIDTLVKMGLIPQDQATQGRMVLAMFANTSATADEMTSTLEFKDKHFFANGQQLQ